MRKTDYFGTFLQTFNARTAGGSAAAPSSTAGGLDGVLARLQELGGSASLKDLLPVVGNSLDGALAVVQQLSDLGMVERNGTSVALTNEGTDTAGTIKR